MSPLALRAFGYALVLSLLFGSLPVLAAASQPVLYSIGASAPRTLAQGAQKSWPIKISEESAMDAVFQGGMWLPTPSGGRVYAKYARHIVHANGIWTWVGTVDTLHGAQQVVLTFGKDGVFGMVPQASGYPLRIVTSQGETRVVETSAAAMARSTQTLRLRSQRDYAIPPRIAPKGAQNTLMMRAAADAAVKQAAASSSPVIIDVMVAYSQGFANMLGSQKLALIRIQNLVDITNQAYIASGVNQRIRLVYTTQVHYPDNTSNQSALDDITGIDENGNPVSIPASLANIASLRTQYGADLVAMIRSYDNSTQGDCGVGWLIGGGQAQIVPSESNAYGYSVVSDGSSGGYYCLDTTFAHELGHNMGDAHDKAHATETGAYTYSYGYVGNGFATIMAYGALTDTTMSVFSNPNISTCKNQPCGVPNSADNARSMNNTAALIAAFEPTMVDTPPSVFTYAHNDINGDYKSDLIWRSNDSEQFAYWIMSGGHLLRSLAIPVSPVFKLVAMGDFNGDGMTDVIWTDGADLYMWVGSGSAFTSVHMRPYPVGWTVVGTGDVNGDGFTDLIWANGGQIAEWLMNGTNFKASYRQNLAGGWHNLTTGDFDGDGRTDLLLTNGSAMQMWTGFNAGSFSAVSTHAYPSNGWTALGAGDINGDGKADVLWRDSSRTHFAYWIMNGPQLAKSWLVAVTPDWTFGTAGDFNSDGLLDLVWYNGSQIVMWPGNSTGIYKGTVIHAYPSGGWAMLP